MEIINAALIFGALVLMWGALNLDRSPTARIEVDQNSQLNDSMTFLQKFRRKSAKEEIQNRRIRAFQANLEQIMSENPEMLLGVEEEFASKTTSNQSQLGSLIGETRRVHQTILDQRNQRVILTENQQMVMDTAMSELSELAGEIIELKAATDQCNREMAGMSKQIDQVKSCVGY